MKRSSLSISYFVLAGVVFATCYATPSFAETQLYRWTDARGKVGFGAKPPAGASEVEPLRGKSFSRYSSKKLIKGYGYKTKDSTPLIDPKVEKIETLSSESSVRPLGASLEHGKVDFEVSPQNEIARTETQITNSGTETAASIKVSFSFSDGTLVPADGPDVLKPGENGMYKIPASRLPIKLGVDATSLPAGEDDVDETPEVIFDFVSAPT